MAAAVTVALTSLGGYNGIGMSLGNLATLSDARTRCITPENMSGKPGCGGMAVPRNPATENVNNASHAANALGQGWKVNPFLWVKSNETLTLVDIEGPGAIQHIWMTLTGSWRWSIVRIYWDNEEAPSVEVPAADFFCVGWNKYVPINSASVCVNPGSAFNCYWTMPFRRRCRITLQNVNPTEQVRVYYAVDYTLTSVPDDQAYFHAQFRRTRIDRDSLFTILDGVSGRGHYVGTYLAWGVNNTGWWGEGEVKFFIDGDDRFPTICTTGLEDYFCGSYNFEADGRYQEFCTPYAGLCQVIRPNGLYESQQRFGLYRWHVLDPVRFTESLRVTVQDLGWRHNGAYLKQHSDIASTAFWYQVEPHASFPQFPKPDELEPL